MNLGRLIDTRRIRKSHPPEGSSTRKSKKSLPKLAKSKAQVLAGQFWRNAHWQKEQEVFFKHCKQHAPAPQFTVSCATRLFCAVAFFSLLCRRCFEGKRRVTSSFAVPTYTHPCSRDFLRSEFQIERRCSPPKPRLTLFPKLIYRKSWKMFGQQMLNRMPYCNIKRSKCESDMWNWK